VAAHLLPLRCTDAMGSPGLRALRVALGLAKPKARACAAQLLSK
jgi:hypothetical protein